MPMRRTTPSCAHSLHEHADTTVAMNNGALDRACGPPQRGPLGSSRDRDGMATFRQKAEREAARAVTTPSRAHDPCLSSQSAYCVEPPSCSEHFRRERRRADSYGR